VKSHREIAEGVLRLGELREANIVLLGGDKKIGPKPMPFSDQVLDLRSKEGMMVSKALEKDNLSTDVDKGIPEPFRFCDSCETNNPFPSEKLRIISLAKAGKNKAFRHMLTRESGLGPKLLLEVVHYEEIGPMPCPR